MLATLWFHRSCGNDLLVTIEPSAVRGFIYELYDTGLENGTFRDEPEWNESFLSNKLDSSENIQIVTVENIQTILAPEGFVPPANMYKKIFLATPEQAVEILTGLPWPYFTREEILREVNPAFRKQAEGDDGFAKNILAATARQMEPKLIRIDSLEHYIFLMVCKRARVTLWPREEPYDIREPWKTMDQLDQELEAYMAMPITA